MAGLDSRYICTSDLESIFLDKLNGLVLAGGRVEFYIENSNTPKEVFTTTGSPPTGFITLGTTVTLDSIGQYSNGVNSVVVYYYPYDADGNLQLYRVRVYSSDNILQFTREAWPPLASNLAPQPGTDSGVQNYIPNGQFLSHNNHIITDTTTESGITISEIAQGGWSFKHTTAGTGVYTITFNSEGFSTGLLDAPPFSVNIACTAFDASDVIRDLVIQWPDVNTFSRKNLTIEFNLFFRGRLNTGTSETFNAYIIRNYGTGGSTTDVSAPIPITVTTSYSTPFNLQILMDDNSSKTTGTGSFIAIAIRGPSNTYNARFTDFALTLGAANLTSFPLMTNDEQLSRGVAGWMPTPNPDGSDLYLPLVLTQKGMTFSNADIGKIYASPFKTARVGELICDGSSYITAGYSSDKIPYSRLFNQIFDATTNMPAFGTGASFVSTYTSTTATDHIIMSTNNTGLQTLAANGTTSPVFTYATNLLGGAGVSFSAYTNTSAVVTAICANQGASFGALSAGTSGMTVADIRNNASTRYAFNVTALTAAALGNGAGTGKYFDFYNTGSGYRFWFKTATETAPAAGGLNLVEVDLHINYSARDVAIILASAISGFQSQSITTTTGAIVPASSYFLLYANSQKYVVWYTVQGVGVQPSAPDTSGGIFIPVSILTADTAALVASKTRTAINSYQFAVPNLQGMFLRGYDPTSSWDQNQNTGRFSPVSNMPATDPGTFELDSFAGHLHSGGAASFIVATGALAATAAGADWGTQAATALTGINETRPLNYMVNWMIKY